ncbi:hypothetical protein [uncultured Martelella sp.]|uniref:hypothetical protein n=1 Tax=uncultured Martelella sp. TaxID=392331 RepID=UPI0029C6B4BA|nr:hypothetical protein [uncultured Martelella sp.]
MEAAFSAIAGLFSGGGAAAATTAATAAGAAGAAGTVAPAVAAGSGLAALKTGIIGLSAISALGQIGMGFAERDIARAQADEADLQAGQERLDAQQRQNRIRREMASILGETKGKYASAGVDLTGGIAAGQARKTAEDAAEQISIDRRDSEFVQAQYRARARNLRRKGGMAAAGGLLNAINTGANTALNIRQLGA